MVWDEIMEKSPKMKALVENKIAEEVGKKQVEIDELKAENNVLTANNDTLQSHVADMQIALAEILGV